MPDLGQRIGTREWWRGLAACTALCGAAWMLSPGIRPVLGYAAPAATGAAFEETRTQGIAPLAYGATTGRRMAAGSLGPAAQGNAERPADRADRRARRRRHPGQRTATRRDRPQRGRDDRGAGAPTRCGSTA
ncbi:hypothetical protein AB5I41_21380 [Sphingomonas sp. MMS24-JH45]